MNVYFVPHSTEHPQIKKYLDYNNIAWQAWDEWDFGAKSTLKMPAGKNLVIIPPVILEYLDLDSFREQVNASDCILYFAQQGDCTGILYDLDAGPQRGVIYADYLETLDAEIYFHIDAIPEKDDNRIVTSTPFVYSQIVRQPRLGNTFVRDKDFLLLTVITANRPHRHIFYEQIKQTDLLSNYIGNITDVWGEVYPKHQRWQSEEHIQSQSDEQKITEIPFVENPIGTTTYVAGISEVMPAGIIPWDLYHQSHYEVVLETYHSDYTYYTEKALRPISAEHPFVVVSNPDFYKCLHNHGFETFGDIIDESFAYEQDLDTRISKLINTMKDLDPREFYELSKEKCTHNYNNLCVQYNRDYQKLFTDLDIFFEKIGLTK